MSNTPSYSIIIPAYKEVLNIRPLLTRIRAAFANPTSPIPLSAIEVLIVDDNSRDGSVELVNELQQEGFPVRILVRTDERGLSSAVVRGFREAKGEAMVCMDADLQVRPFFALLHPESTRSKLGANARNVLKADSLTRTSRRSVLPARSTLPRWSPSCSRPSRLARRSPSERATGRACRWTTRGRCTAE